MKKCLLYGPCPYEVSGYCNSHNECEMREETINYEKMYVCVCDCHYLSSAFVCCPVCGKNQISRTFYRKCSC